MNSKKIKVVYINGIRTDKEEAEAGRKALEDLLGHPVELFHNETRSTLFDLIESFWNRRLYKLMPAGITKRFRKRIINIFEEEKLYYGENGRLHIVAHSQGTAIAMNALRMIPPFLRGMIDVSLFAPVNVHEDVGGTYVEYFANQFDKVVTTLLQGREPDSGRPVFIRYAQRGHDFIEDYLKPLERHVPGSPDAFLGGVAYSKIRKFIVDKEIRELVDRKEEE